jgi:hypothetical protein
MSAINHHVRRFRSLDAALKELERFVLNSRHLQDGRPPFAQFGDMRSREMLANWLLCVVANATWENAKLTFCSDPTGGDGIIWDEASGETWPTEHVMVPNLPDQADDAEALILEKVDHKRQGGEPYGSGKTLVVFLNAGAGEWHPNSVARRLPEPLYFATVWVVGLQGVESGEYVYNVTNLDLSAGNVPIFKVRIGQNFDRWHVTRCQ